MKELLAIILFLLIGQQPNLAYGSNDSDFDFGDLKVRCACDNEEHHKSSRGELEGEWYRKVGLQPPPRFSPEQVLQKIKLENIPIKNEKLEEKWYEKAGFSPPPDVSIINT